MTEAITRLTALQRATILLEGHNCWRIARAERLAFLIDADAYFRAFAAAAERARHRICILGWDMDSRVRLRPPREANGLPVEFGPFLNALVARRPELEVYLLSWDYSVIYAFEREPLPALKLGWRTHRRIHFRLDGHHPPGASHHQKVAVIDDRLAFVGGLDFAVRRWDTPAHAAVDLRRVDTAGRPYPPFHDVQVMLEGEAAACLGELVRARWRRVVRRVPAPLPASRHALWPASVAPDLADTEVAISRTEPAQDARAAVCEIRNVWLDAIAAAQRSLYIENQYFTSKAIVAAIAKRLAEPEGPEVVLVLPKQTEGWLEESVMGVLRAKALTRLRKADAHGRLRVFYPVIPAADGARGVMVHSKVLVVDERLARVGSSNTSNRSMGLDTECDVSIESVGEARVAQAIAGLRNRLLAEHLGVNEEAVRRVHAQTGSLITTIEALQGDARGLAELDGLPPDIALNVIAEPRDFDPETPIPPNAVIANYIPPEVQRHANHRWARNVAIVVTLAALAAAWHWTPLRHAFDIDTATRWIGWIRDNPATPVVMLLAYLVGGLLFVPITLLIAATAVAFGPIASIVYAFVGCFASASATYAIGRRMGRDTVQRLMGKRLQRLGHWLSRRGFITMLTLRLVPIAPFTITNLVAGALHIRLRDFLLATFIGLAPGIVAISAFAHSLTLTLKRPTPHSLALLVLLSLAIVAVAVALRRWLARHQTPPDTEVSGD